MSAAALLAELAAAGISVTRVGDTLKVRALPGVRIAPYRERIRSDKPALMRELLQQQIVMTATVDPEEFDRAAYDHLWVRWRIAQAKEASTP